MLVHHLNVPPPEGPVGERPAHVRRIKQGANPRDGIARRRLELRNATDAGRVLGGGPASNLPEHEDVDQSVRAETIRPMDTGRDGSGRVETGHVCFRPAR